MDFATSFRLIAPEMLLSIQGLVLDKPKPEKKEGE